MQPGGRRARLTDCNFENIAEGNVLENVSGLRCENVKINGKAFQPNAAH